MATPKRERQKAARRQKMEQMQRDAKRRRSLRRGAVFGGLAVVIVVAAAFVFSGSSPTPTTTTLAQASATTTTAPSTTSTTIPLHFAKVRQPSPAGTFGTAPTVTVPTGKPPAKMEVSNLINGTGTVAKSGETLEVQYVLATYSAGKVIQSSWTSQPFSFKLGAGQVISGWDLGLVGMHVGGRRELVIPPILGYGSTSPGAGIAANDTLVFVVDLLKVTP